MLVQPNFAGELVLREILIKKIGRVSKEFKRREDVPPELRKASTEVLARVLNSYAH